MRSLKRSPAMVKKVVSRLGTLLSDCAFVLKGGDDCYGHLFPRGNDAAQIDAAELRLIGSGR